MTHIFMSCKKHLSAHCWSGSLLEWIGLVVISLLEISLLTTSHTIIKASLWHSCISNYTRCNTLNISILINCLFACQKWWGSSSRIIINRYWYFCYRLSFCMHDINHLYFSHSNSCSWWLIALFIKVLDETTRRILLLLFAR